MSANRSVRGRLVAVGAALAVLVTLFPAVGSAAVAEACPVDLPSSGYRDLGGLTAETIDAIDCITHYAIAQGVNSNTFDPNGVVTRWQMALFLIRMADDMGIAVPSGGANQFNDIAGFPSATQQAINQLALLGITSGVGGGRFDPNGVVSRWQMALFLTRVHARAGYPMPSGQPQGFADIAAYPAYAQLAINQLAQLGITKGTSANTFSPAGNVLRWQMALFLSRELRAGGATPYRITVSANPVTSPTNGQVILTATVTKPDGTPVVGRSVDVFVGSLDSAGRCVLDADAKLANSDAGTSTNCRIDSNDPKTNASGKVTLVFTHANVIEIDRVYVWIGASGETFDIDTTQHYATADVSWSAQPVAIVVGSKTVKFGTNVTVTGWLVDAQGRVVTAAGSRIQATVARGGSQIIARTLVTAADGTFLFSYTGPSDPDATAADDPILDTVKAFWDKDADGVDDGAAEFDVTATITWDDDAPRADKATLSQSSVSTLAGQTNTVTAVVTDKFGTPINNASVVFTVLGANPVVSGSLTTNASGQAAFAYATATPGVDTIDAEVDVDGGGVDITAGQIADLTHYTVETAPNIGGNTTYTVVAVNTGADTVDVVGGSGYYRLTWDSTNDLFSANNVASSMNTFESALGGLALPGVNKLRTNSYESAPAGASVFFLTTP